MDAANIDEKIALFTCSHRPDFNRCVRLCKSMDEFISSDIAQFIVVPDRDRKLFATLESKNRKILSTQEILPARYIQLPLFKKWWLDNGMWPTRGWMMQQVTKLCADAVTDCEHIIFVDSDIEFIRPLQHDRFVHQNAFRLLRKPMHKNEGVHLKWHHATAELLGFSPQYFGSDYIGPLATWKRSNLIQLKDHIEGHREQPWYEAVGRRMTVSEYTLYGVFVEHVLGIEQSGHFQASDDICHCLWFGNETDKFLTQFDHSTAPQAILMQSNIGLNQDDVNALMVKLRQNVGIA